MGHWFTSRNGFKELSQSEDEEVESLKDTRIIRPNLLLCCIFIPCFAASFFLGTLFANIQANADVYCTNHISGGSPLLADLDMAYETVHFNGSLLQENVFRQDAGPEVDAAWASLGVDYRSAIVPTDRAAAAGLSQAHVQISPKYGGGFPANVEGLHHLHCLNLLRQALYYNYEYYHDLGNGAFRNDDDIVRYHVSHCLDILRQQLMCTVDIGVLGQVWWNRDTPMAYPDFNTQHKCRKFESVRSWAESHQAPEDVPEDFLAPPRDVTDVYEKIP